MRYCRHCGFPPDYHSDECIAYLNDYREGVSELPSKRHSWVYSDTDDNIVCSFCEKELSGESTCSNSRLFSKHHNYVTREEADKLRQEHKEKMDADHIKEYKSYGIDIPLINKAVEENIAHLKIWLLSKLKSDSNHKLLKALIRKAIKKHSSHCSKFFIDAEFKSKIHKVAKDSEGRPSLSSLWNGGEYEVKGSTLSNPFPFFHAIQITSTAQAEENISILVLLDAEITKEKQEMNVQEVHRIVGAMKASKCVYITTTDFQLSNLPQDIPFHHINGNTIAEILIDLEIAVKPLYKICKPDSSFFIEF